MSQSDEQSTVPFIKMQHAQPEFRSEGPKPKRAYIELTLTRARSPQEITYDPRTPSRNPAHNLPHLMPRNRLFKLPQSCFRPVLYSQIRAQFPYGLYTPPELPPFYPYDNIHIRNAG
ncbi:hypothetical protein HYALB_00001720 [Hymenoscyphus albidus]|uniref:Uncharacterized protein n=1 Tax=Hymenoscyphus albidus TaxID=595503 RepID=A0A9N9LEK3_9HELO|nr:hypothetical protein HYALB_00001720 [Hymenoscyphus albidus]